jgi:hypothetical protein
MRTAQPRSSPPTVLMALVAVHAVVDIPADVRVMEIVRVPAPMATRTLENRVVVRIRMAGGTNTVGVAVINVPPAVIKSRAGPCRCVVTGGASRREDGWRRLMDGIRSVVVVRRMAAVARRGEGGLVVVYVATGAGDLGVEARQRERGCVVVKLAVGPERRVMA